MEYLFIFELPPPPQFFPSCTPFLDGIKTSIPHYPPTPGKKLLCSLLKLPNVLHTGKCYKRPFTNGTWPSISWQKYIPNNQPSTGDIVERVGTIFLILWEWKLIKHYWWQVFRLLLEVVGKPITLDPALALLHVGIHKISFQSRMVAIHLLLGAKLCGEEVEINCNSSFYGINSWLTSSPIIVWWNAFLRYNTLLKFDKNRKLWTSNLHCRL